LSLLSIKKAQMTLFPSTQARVDIEKYGVRIRHAEVVYHGINKELFHPCHDDKKANQVKQKYGLDKFILFVSHIQRYKNFLELIKAFVLLNGRIDKDIRLVFAGRCFDREYYDEMQAFIAGHGYQGRIIFLGSIPYEELPYLYSSCKLFVFPSTCESFGMSLVEAMACGAPILASRLEPMPEICADAAIYFDPTNPAAMAEIIYNTLNDQRLISALTKKSLERAVCFSWENTAKKTLKIFEGIP
jgi:glycosyltransferase involved in cell wall biosynthesis